MTPGESLVVLSLTATVFFALRLVTLLPDWVDDFVRGVLAIRRSMAYYRDLRRQEMEGTPNGR